VNILGIETSCDETAAAVVKDGREVLSNVVYTQIPLHVPYGGVVPEIASRAHVEKIGQVVREALRGAPPIDAVAVTYGPGLSPALIVGLNAAKGLARALCVPLIAINHIEAHLHTPFLYDVGEDKHHCPTSDLGPLTSDLGPLTCTPALGLAISGGNTVLIDMPEYGRYEVIGETLDDAAGEAFDKAAKLLGLGYPGGLKIDRISAAYVAGMRGQRSEVKGQRSEVKGQRSEVKGQRSEVKGQRPHASSLTSDLGHLTSLIPFPKGRPRDGVTALAGLPAELCVSFSGLKTALLRYVQQHPELTDGSEAPQYFGGYSVTPGVARVVASYQEAIVQAVADRTRAALRRKSYRSLIVGGGVSLNSRIRAVLAEVAAEAKVELLMARPKYTGDNGAMIAGLAYYRRNHVEDALSLDVNPCLEVGDHEV